MASNAREPLLRRGGGFRTSPQASPATCPHSGIRAESINGAKHGPRFLFVFSSEIYPFKEALPSFVSYVPDGHVSHIGLNFNRDRDSAASINLHCYFKK